MKTAALTKWLLSIFILSLAAGPAWAGSLKTETLEQKIIEISSLQAKMMDKIDQAFEMRIRLDRRRAELVDEIHAEQIHQGIDTFPEAMQNRRICYNLSLIQLLRAYVNRLDERMLYFQTGKERLKFFIIQIDDDMAIIHTLKDMEIDLLIGRINLVLDEFNPETRKQIFDAADIRLMPLELVWNELRIIPG